MAGNALVSYEERFKRDAQALAEREARSGSTISTRGGVFSVAGEPLGTRITVIVVDSWFANEYFPEDSVFDADNPIPPVCYAFGRSKGEMGPHPSMQVDLSYFTPQNATCQGCPKNEWGSASRGRGKACKNREKLAILPAGYYTPQRGRTPPELNLYDTPDHFLKADIVTLALPVTSVENWSKYVTQVAAAQQRPPYAVYTEISIQPDQKSQYKLHFEFLDLCPDELFEPIIQRVDAFLQQPFAGHTPPSEPDEGPAPAPAYGRATSAARGLRR